MKTKNFCGIRAAVAAIALIASSQASAGFMPVLDEFWIVKNGTEVFRDSFTDGAKPPSGPDGARTYTASGLAGITSEAGGKLTMTPSLGQPVLISGTVANVATGALRNLSANDQNANFLGFASSFEMHALYDLSSLPTMSGQSFQLRAIDRAPSLGNDGNNAYGVLIGFRGTTNEVTVSLHHSDYEANTSTVIDTDPIQDLLGTADQIELILSKDQESDELIASYKVYDGATLLRQFVFDTNDDPLKIYIGEDYIRAQFVATDTVTIPEPGTLALVGASLVGFALRRRRTR